MSLTWRALHASVVQMVEQAREDGATDALLADGVLRRQRDEALPPEAAPFARAVRHLGWLLLGRMPTVDPAGSVALKVSLSMTAQGVGPLSEAILLARASEEADQAQAAALPAPERATRFYNRAVAFGEQGDALSAIADATAALAAMPDDTQALMNRGTWRVQLQDYDGAMADWLHAVEVDPGYALGWLKIGALKLGFGMPEGVEDVKRGLALAPPDWPHRAEAEAWVRRAEG
ncbi:MAG: hypothetical protein H6739_38080 [Alphaproteobacteria bacterium]|nr:hypothetical protein [Alphaproteobacteria bacterium]